MTLNVELLASGSRPPAWVTDGFEEYAKRLPRDWRLQLTEMPVARRSKTTSVEKLKLDEGQRMLEQMKPGAMVIALDSRGESMTTPQLAKMLDDGMQNFSRIQMLIGGPDGLSDACLDAAHKVWSLSKLTFPHFMVRILVAEQLYRAWSILNNHPYHK